MGRMGTLVLAAAGLAAAVVLFLVLRPDDSDETGSTAPTTTAATTGTEGDGETAEPTTTEEGEEEPATPRPLVVRIAVREGEAKIERVEVERGRRVVLVVRSDVADHVHLHGYDLMRDVAPGQPARIAFRATIPGPFEVELENRHQQIAELTVQP